jgi:hypothetical protein
LPKAVVIAAPAETLPIWSKDGFGSAILSTRPANQAAGTIKSDNTTKPANPIRHPKSWLSTCPIGADNSAPSEPAAEMMPSAVLRTVSGTARAVTDIAIAAAVQASDIPISTPAPNTTPRRPCALAIRTSPAT